MRQSGDAAPATLGRTPPQPAPGSRTPSSRPPSPRNGVLREVPTCAGHSWRMLSPWLCCAGGVCEGHVPAPPPNPCVCTWLCVCACTSVCTRSPRVDAVSPRVQSCVCHCAFPHVSPRVPARVSVPRCTAVAERRGSARSCRRTRPHACAPVCSAPCTRCVCVAVACLRVLEWPRWPGVTQPPGSPGMPPPHPLPAPGLCWERAVLGDGDTQG